MEKVLGFGGVFFKADDPQKLAAWYAQHLGVPLNGEDSYAVFLSRGADEPSVWSAFSRDSEYFGGPGARWMINYRVSDLDAMLKQLRDAGVSVEDKIDDSFGRFGWATDPEGNRIELWEPPQT